ncbi:MAG: pseudouridine synthase [Burkholderiaceae bacterium]
MIRKPNASFRGRRPNVPVRPRRPAPAITQLLVFNKPFGVLCQFSSDGGRESLATYIDFPDVYPAGRLDRDSEGLILLTNDGRLQNDITNPRRKMPKVYCVQVEGEVTAEAAKQLASGLSLNDGPTRPCQVRLITEPKWLWDREPPVRYRASIPTSWLEITLTEGRNRQIRRMTAAVGFPTLRLIRTQIGPVKLDGLAPGIAREVPLGTFRD